MDKTKELDDTQKIVEGEGEPKVPTLTEEEIAELKRKAEVSSQNFERAKKAEQRMKELEDALKSNQQQTFGEDDYSDEGKALRSEIFSLREEISSFKRLKEEESIFSKYPQVKDKMDDFKEYLNDPENKGLSLEKVAKLFMVENNLIIPESAPRKGLEKPTSGDKVIKQKGLSEEDVRKLRETQPRKYEDMLRSGKLNPDEIIN